MSSTTETQKSQTYSPNTTMPQNTGAGITMSQKLDEKNPDSGNTASQNPDKKNHDSDTTAQQSSEEEESDSDTTASQSSEDDSDSDTTASQIREHDPNYEATLKARWELAVERVLKADEEAWERCEKLTQEERFNMMAGGNPEVYQWLMSYKWTEAKDLPADYWDDV